MEEKYKAFTEFDWADDRWHAYLDNLYPPPDYKQVAKFKKKWYKKTIDNDFDVTYDPDASRSCPSGGGTGTSTGGSAGAAWAGAPMDSGGWSSVGGTKRTACFFLYGVGVLSAVLAIVGVANPKQGLGLLTFSFMAEVLVKHGMRFSKEWLQKAMQEDVGIMPFMALVIFMPGMSAAMQVLGTMPFFLTALLSFGQICKSQGSGGFIERRVAPLAEVSNRYQIMQMRAHLEVAIGIAFVAGVFTKMNSPMSPLLWWNLLSMRYAMSPWTQSTFRSLDGSLSRVLGRIPVVSTVYDKMKGAMHHFATNRQQGSCNIL